MFFTPELLAKRDSGFGLLWLAATLGSRSTFKKLPKRSVLSADIAQLCDLISEPVEPLALRLSSNLMFGVVRVYKGHRLGVDIFLMLISIHSVKQELFLTDVTNCVTSLKKVVQDMHNQGASVQLQMPNPVARPSTLTVVANPKAPYVLDFDAFVADWDEYLNIDVDTSRASEEAAEDDGDDAFNPVATKKKQGKSTVKTVAKTEAPRKEAHTLEEHHDHLLSASFDLSFDKAASGDISSSQAAGGFEDFFACSDGLDLGDGLGDGLGEDLARELGWAASPVKSVVSARKRPFARGSSVGNPYDDQGMNLDLDFNFDVNDAYIAAYPEQPVPEKDHTTQTQRSQSMIPLPANREASPATSFAQMLLSQDVEQQPLINITNEAVGGKNRGVPRKLKRTRLLLDARTELTDDELKIARAKYLEFQNCMRREMLAKKMEKEHGKAIEGLIWGVPQGIHARGLIQFWQHNFKVQVEARSGVVRLHEIDDVNEPARKRKKHSEEADANVVDTEIPTNAGDWDMDWLAADNVDNAMTMDAADAHRQSSEEPGQARRISRSASILGSHNVGFDLGPRDPANGSQRSSLFPWDNAGPSSSTGNDVFPAICDEQVVVPVSIHLRSSPVSRHDSPLVSSQRGSLPPRAGTVLFSPAVSEKDQPILGEDFVFDVEHAPFPEDTQQETQKSDLNLITLERNSFNFLEYAKMQHQTLPGDRRLTFEVVVPKATSTRHVAAAAFYHCLVLATKNLLQLKQKGAYESFTIGIV